MTDTNLTSTLAPLHTVLLIEDNPGDARLVGLYLEERFPHGCQLEHVPTLSAAVKALKLNRYDIVLLDLGLPDSQGLESWFVVNRAAPRTPVVIFTGEDDDDQALHALRIGAEDYLAKRHVNGTTLARTIRGAVHRRRQIEWLRSSEERYRALVESMGAAVLQLTADGRVRFMNGRACDLLGATDTRLQLMLAQGALQWSRWLKPDDRVAAAQLLMVAHGQRNHAELQLRTEHGSAVWVLASAASLNGEMAIPPDTAPHEVVLMLVDITDRKEAEADWLRLHAEVEQNAAQRVARLEAAQAEVQAVQRSLAHDLRTPLNGIVGLVQLARRDGGEVIPDRTRMRLELIERVALDMDRLITGLLAIAANERQPLKLEAVDLSAIVQTVADRLMATAPQRPVHWSIEPGVTAIADRLLVVSVVQNLIDNAWKYSSQVEPSRIAFGHATAPDGQPACFVRDNGVGFAPEHAHRLFQPFQRLPSAAGFAGHGLGLANVRSIVERHGGVVWAESHPGVQTTFWVRFAPAPAAKDPKLT